MAYMDGTDPDAAPNGPNDTPDPAPGQNPITGTAATNVSQIQAWYQQYLGRQASLTELNAQLGNPGGLSAVQTLIQNSPEAQAYATSQQQQPGTDAPTTQQPPPSTYQPPTQAPTATAAPTYTPPAYTPPPAFNYADFVAPDANKLNDDPLFKFTMAREQDAISKRAAAGGGLFTGGTYDALMRNAADISSAGYQQMYDRDLKGYMTNRGNAIDTYNTNYGTQYRDPAQIRYQGSQDAFNSQIHNFDMGRQYDWARTMFGQQQANDDFDHKYRIYSGL